MKLKEIHMSVPRDEFNENYIHYFNNTPIIYTHQPTGYKLKRSIDEFGDVRYGLFSQDENQLIAYAHFSKEDDHYVSSMPSTLSNYRKQGWMSLIFDFAINKDGLSVVSDGQQTPEARMFWRSLKSRGEFEVTPYNYDTHQELDWSPDNDPYNERNSQTHRFIARRYTIREQHIMESYAPGSSRSIRAERRRLGIYDYGKYGPGTSNEELGFVNW